jgi:HSP20 family molecular chaperone IbpA
VSVRYQRVRYRYAVVLGGPQLRPLDEGWGSVSRQPVIAQPRWRPRADVAQSSTSITITVELAGVDPAEIEAVLYEDVLVISGRRQLPGPGSGGVYHAAEISQGSFRVEIGVPASIRPELTRARYERGLLHLTLAKAHGEDDGR